VGKPDSASLENHQAHASGMNAGEAVLRTLVSSGVDTCFANPGTSELAFVAALDRVPEMRPVLCLQENVATGAADGYGRMRGHPAATLLHLGPGLANGLACLHNARRARTPLVNIVGDHATYHRHLDAPLTTDIEAVASPFSDKVIASGSAADAPLDAAQAVQAAITPPGAVASLILPADVCWGEAQVADALGAPKAEQIPDTRIDDAVRLLRSGRRTLLYLGGSALQQRGIAAAARIAAATRVDILAPPHNARIDRGAGNVAIDRLPYSVDQALSRLAGYEQAILIGAPRPVAFFAYPGRPGELLSSHCKTLEIAEPDDDIIEGLERLADALGADEPATIESFAPPDLPTGRLTPEAVARTLANLAPDQAIVAEDAVSSGRGFFPITRMARQHTWLQNVGGAIGHGLPMATGAAVACPNRKVICLQADGAGMFTLQSLWTQAHEGLNVLTVIFSNSAYAILQAEFRNVGIEEVGERARELTVLMQPSLDWIDLARGMGVEAVRATDAEEFVRAFRRGIATSGPFLIEAIV
jgi:acetolactate synthase-1/2/3 large subunit